MIATPKQGEQLAADLRIVADGINGGLMAMLYAQEEARAASIATPSYVSSAEAELRRAHEAIGRLSSILASLTALSVAPNAPSIPLDQLDTPDTRELLATLERAQQIAERIDADRGRTVGDAIPLQPGESAGTDLAESISLLALRVRQEVYGARSPHE